MPGVLPQHGGCVNEESLGGIPAILSTADGATPLASPITYNIDSVTRRRGLTEWFRTIIGRERHRDHKVVMEGGELQMTLPTSADSNDFNAAGEVCLLTESPYRILRAAENGNLLDFKRLYMGDPARLNTRDARGRTAAHHACVRDSTSIIHAIFEFGGDVNAQDAAGNTPLHVATEYNALECVNLLLKLNVDTGILNEKKQAVIHLATELNRVDVLKVLAKYKDRINVDAGGEHGRTALHLAAIHDHDQCARILIVDFGAAPKIPCNNGYYPIHEAAKNASSRTMEEFLKWGESCGLPREQMISLFDNEGNVPLHSAVHGGDIKAVELCIRSGAKISTQQHDLSTPVHLACSQGALDIVKLMFRLQPEETKASLMSCDVQKMTPLHCAAMFDHSEIVKYLFSQGSDLNPLDKEKRSPLLLAASRGGWRTVHTLIQLGADITLKDDNMRNVLHLVVMNGGRLNEFAATCKQYMERDMYERNLALLLNEKDSAGCSPLHYASREGQIKSLENLIKLGACINLKNHNNESPLHFAARYGRYNTARQLLDSDKGTFIINESDGEGLTPLHIASREGYTRVVQLLLNRGALLHRDHNGRNPLHLAAMSGYTLTIIMLNSVHSHLLDQIDKDGNTPLHLATMENKSKSISLLLSMDCKMLYNKKNMSAIDYAIYYKFPEAALAMVTHEARAKEVLALKSDKHPCVVLALIAYMPRVFEAVQDKCITKANCKKDSKSFYIKYDFSILRCWLNPKDVTSELPEALRHPLPALNIKYSFKYYQKSKLELEEYRLAHNEPNYRQTPLLVINAMVNHGRVELLAHPLSQKYLQMKWNSYGKYFHLANLLFYCIFLIFATIYAYLLTQYSDLLAHERDAAGRQFSDNITSLYGLQTSKDDDIKFEVRAVMYASTLGIAQYILLCSLREIYNMVQRKWDYLLDPTNLVSWMLYVAAGIMIFPTATGISVNVQSSAASIAAFLTYVHLLLLLQRFDRVGLYVVMFLQILQTLIRVLMVFSILIVAFGLAFYILMSKGNHLSFSSIPMSMMRVFSMMLGEIDFIGTYVQPYYEKDDERTLPYPVPVFLMIMMFMILMPILLMNLLIGLAVGDIESVKRNAQLKRLAMQVVLHTELESKLPTFILEKVDKNELIEYPNENKCKIGFLDFILRKWFMNPFNDDAALDMVLESDNDYLGNQMEKQRRALKEMGQSMEKLQGLLRLIVQKMEIKTESDDVDEGVSPNESRFTTPLWSQRRIRHRMNSTTSFNKSYT